jgi:tRNA G46 methylase TrmB
VFHGDAHEVLNCLPDECADYVHVLFPDPWPKRRHKNRRMVDHDFWWRSRAFSRQAGGSAW